MYAMAAGGCAHVSAVAARHDQGRGCALAWQMCVAAGGCHLRRDGFPRRLPDRLALCAAGRAALGQHVMKGAVVGASPGPAAPGVFGGQDWRGESLMVSAGALSEPLAAVDEFTRSEEHTSELQSP